MKEELINCLETLNYPVYLQGSLASPADYPDSFFAFWDFQNNESAFYDNGANRCIWGFWVYFYSTSPQNVHDIPEQARQLLRQNGFIVEGKPSDVRVDAPTHTGAMFTCYGVENYAESTTEGGNANA